MSRRPRHSFALLLSASLLAITASAASAAPANPVVSVSAGPPNGGSVTVTVAVNRAPNQIASCRYSVDASNVIDCPNQVAGSKSTTYSVELVDVSPGDHMVDVAVNLKNGGAASGSASFSIEAPGPRLFAVAFSDTNGNHSYEVGTDRLIAALIDTNLDGTVSVGDTIETDTFPLSFDPVAEFGAFTTKSATVTSVTGFTSGSVQVASTATLMTWASGPVEVVQWFPAAGGPESVLVDAGQPSDIFDEISITAGAGLGAVPSDVAASVQDQANGAFLDIRLDLP